MPKGGKSVPVLTKIKKYKNDLVCESRWIGLEDQSFTDKFTDVFAEHIKGFGQKRRKIKEWKQNLRKKKKGENKKLSDKELADIRAQVVSNYKKQQFGKQQRRTKQRINLAGLRTVGRQSQFVMPGSKPQQQGRNMTAKYGVVKKQRRN